ncbi:MAG: response regulator [Planctomycetes bacterium]|nr:response regulator [Planctomycetota bacterium]
MSTTSRLLPRPIDILLVDDDPADVLLTKKALDDGKVYNTLNVVKDGVKAMSFLRREGEYADVPRPDLILLDLNMPCKDGRETLSEIKADEQLKSIPVVVLTTSDNDDDVAKSYDLQASCYITKPVDFAQFTRVVQSIRDFWLCVVKYPH